MRYLKISVRVIADETQHKSASRAGLSIAEIPSLKSTNVDVEISPTFVEPSKFRR